jgi:hypothetical protein
MAANVALRAAPAARIFVTSTPKRKLNASPQNKPLRTFLRSLCAG